MTTETIAGKYRIEREIARSNDVVYEAVDITMGRRLAVKELVLPSNLTGQGRRERIERFNREARAAGRLSHPNIVTVYDFGESDGRYFIAMEYLEGGTLRDTLQTRGALQIHEAVDIACQVLNALEHAHRHRVVHRDVKPDNIHILPGGQSKLTDFGIARLTEEASVTADGQVFGTPSYMSPEQIEGRTIDHRTDLFSLGVVLYEMLAGRKPFTGDSVVSITYNIMHSQPGPIQGIPISLEQVVFRALAKNANQRYASAEEMRRELKSAETTPSLFFSQPSPQPTGMGYFGQGVAVPAQYPNYPTPLGGSGYSQGPSYPAPSNYGVPQPYPAPSGGFGSQPVPGGAFGGTAYAPPQPAPSSQTPASGPFVSWGQPNPATVVPGIPPPPPFPRRSSSPIIGPGTKTFFSVLVLSAFISAVVVGLVLLFLRAYDENQRKGATLAVTRVINEGTALYEAKKLDEAIVKFEEAVKLAGKSEAGRLARKNLAVALNKKGVRQYELNDLAAAEMLFGRAYDTDPTNEDAKANLRRVYDRLGDRAGAERMWNRSREDGRAGAENPAAPASEESLEARLQRAQGYMNQAAAAYSQGNVDAARELWRKVLGEAPGTPAANQAQANLDSTTTGPSFGLP